MAVYSISYGELESHPVFNITAKCGHTFQVFRKPEVTIEQFIGMYGEEEKCPECYKEALQTLLDEADYRQNPDTAAQGWDRLASSISFESSLIGQDTVPGDEDPELEKGQD